VVLKNPPVKGRNSRHGFAASLQGRRPCQITRNAWFRKLSSPTLFLIVSLTLVGGYFAFTIPVSVFPNTDFRGL